MREYDIINLNTEYEYAVLATSYINPVDKLYEVENTLKNENFRGKILFDMLLCNGFSHNRYLEFDFNGEIFDRNSVSVISSPSSETENIIYHYYKDKDVYLDLSVLPRAQKYLIKNGLLNRIM